MKKYHLLTAILLLSLVSCTQDERSPGFNSLSDSESLKEERLLKEKFVDLIDDYNQGASPTSSYNYDTIKNFPHSIIRTMAATCTDKSAIKSKLQEYVGVYYTSSELTKFLEPYKMLFKIEDHEKSFNTDSLPALLLYVGSIV